MATATLKMAKWILKSKVAWCGSEDQGGCSNISCALEISLCAQGRRPTLHQLECQSLNAEDLGVRRVVSEMVISWI
jgi:hypothetical protein